MRPIALLLLALPLALADEPVWLPEFPRDAAWVEVREGVELRPGTLVVGEIGPAQTDSFTLRLDAASVVSIACFPAPGVVIERFEATTLRRHIAVNPAIALIRLRAPAGTHEIRLSAAHRSKPGRYHLVVRNDVDTPGWEAELADPRSPISLPIGSRYRAFYSSGGDDDRFTFAVERRGVFCLRVERLGPTRAASSPLELHLRVDGDDYAFAHDLDDQEPLFFYPILDPGNHELAVGVRGSELGRAYELELAPVTIGASPDEIRQARAAIDRGLAYLLAGDRPAPRREHALAHRSLRLMALLERGPRELEEARAREVSRLVAQLARGVRTIEGLTFSNAPVRSQGELIYDDSIATLALAEAVAHGHEAARAACADGVRFLLASQLTGRRPERWGPVSIDSPHHGSWRYSARATTGDVSVTGWALIALYAADAAGVRMDGVEQALKSGGKFIAGCADPEAGFRYQPGLRGPPSLIQQSIGGLIMTLLDQPLPATTRALRELDRHLLAPTQVESGQNYPANYAYYATRLHFLRGGYAWESWRHVAMRQLVHRQRGDGSWSAIRSEQFEGSEYATAMAIMVLRLCLNEPPAYLRTDIEGF